MSLRIVPLLLAVFTFTAAMAQDVPANMGRGLAPLLEEYRAQLQSGKSEPDSVRAAIATADRAQADAQARVLVDVVLNGKAPLADVQRRAEALGGKVTASVPWYRKGIFSAWLPLKSAEQLAGAQGVSAVHLAPRPRHRVGAVTSQGATVLKSLQVNTLGYSGSGVTVGVLSDSYNKDQYDKHDPGWTTASDDVQTGDLPGAGNPDGATTPVNVVQDDDNPEYDTDEGRAMLQIVHDVAPGANLAFCTNGNTDSEMVVNINRLKTEGGCNIMCDDVAFDDEPMFSDGQIAQAINTVAGDGVAYFSAIGNDGNSGYEATFNPVTSSSGAKLLAKQGVQWATVPAGERRAIYEWHAFGTGTNGAPVIVQKITTGAGPTSLIFQWNDPFDSSGITADYDILVFNSAGAYSAKLSGVDNNVQSDEPLELPLGYMKPFTTYKICIVLTDRASETPLATRLRYLATDGEDAIVGQYISLGNVAAFGHPTAAGCAGVAAYVYDDAPDPGNNSHTDTPLVDGYSSNGPVDIYFDSNGNRLGAPVIRNQPMFSAVDNVDTTFFPPYPRLPNPNDYDGDGWPNFAGTSAATPHAAGIAALLMNAAAANSKGTLTPAQIQNLMINSTQGVIDEQPLVCSGSAGTILLTNSGDGYTVPNNFEITTSGTTGQTLTSLTIDLSSIGMQFAPKGANGLPFAVLSKTGKPAPTTGKLTYSGGPNGKSSMTIPFKNFEPGDTLSFYIGFDYSDTDMYGYDANELSGATFSATVGGPVVSGTMLNQTGTTYNYKAGYGLLDAQAAVNLLLGP